MMKTPFPRRDWALALLLLATAASAAPVTLFHETFETLALEGPVRRTVPEPLPGSGSAPPGGTLAGPADLAAGKEGKALRLSGPSQVRYAPGTVAVDPDGGELAFWVKLNFDPRQRNEKTRTVLRNQLFVTLWDMSRAHTKVCLYSPGEGAVSAGVFNAANNVVHLVSFKPEWRPDEWHRLSLSWGARLELRWDGTLQASAAVTGLFGAVPADVAKLTTLIGSHLGWSDVDSEFSLDDLTVFGPSPENLAPRPRLCLPQLGLGPVVDGALNEPFWQQAAQVSGFVKLERQELGAVQPVLLGAATAEGLYLGLQVTYPDGRAPRAMLKEHDAAIYSEDTVEVFLQPPGQAEAPYYQFMLSANGTRLDARGAGTAPYRADIGGYNPEWQGATSRQPNGWTAELFIPFAALAESKAPAAGTLWRANVCLDSSAGFSQAVTWAYASGNYCRPAVFGELLFSGKERTLRQERLTGFAEGRPRVSFRLIGDFQPALHVIAHLAGPTGLAVYENRMNLRDTKDIDFALPTLISGDYRLTLTGTDENGLCTFYQCLPFQTARAFDLAVSNYPHAGYLLARVDARGLTDPVGKVVVRLTGPVGLVGAPVELSTLKGGLGELRFPNADLAPGKYEVSAEALSTAGAALASGKAPVELFAKPAWWNNSLGIDHSVPPPFEPVRNAAGTLSVWGRDYVFGADGFPSQIRNQGLEMLRAAPRLLLTSAATAAAVDLARLPATTSDTFPDTVTRSAHQACGEALTVDLKTTVEFDGFLRCDLTLTPSRPVRLDELALSLPLSPALARLLLTSNGPGATAQVLAGPYRSPFMPYLWVGNDDLGLAWFAESDQHWTPGNAEALAITPTAAGSDLRLQMIGKPVQITAPVSFSFGLMATPIRPIPHNDPFALPSWSAPDQVSFAEYLTYPALTLPQPAGTLEFQVRRTHPKPSLNTTLFRIGTQTAGVGCFVITPDQPDRIVLSLYGKASGTLLQAQSLLPLDRFVPVALVWNPDGLALYVDGRLAGRGDASAAKGFVEQLGKENARLRFGSHDDWGGYTGIILDEVRLSRAARYAGDTAPVPTGPLTADAATVLLDPLDDTFQPDGQDARTTAGGVPTIGSAFVVARCGNGLKLEMAPPRAGLDVLQEWRIPVVSDWVWQDEMRRFYGQPVLHDNARLTPGLKEKIADFHQHGIKLIPYALYPAVSSTSGLIEPFGDEWGLRPVSTTPWLLPGTPPGHYFLNCCRNSRSYADYLVSGTAWCLDELGYDGYYSDGLTSLSPCQNEAHGCGYRDATGSLHPTWPFYGTRDVLKRLYRVVKSRNPAHLVVNHCSFTTLAPILSFSDVVYTGEHEDYENLLTGRIRFASKPWGLFIAPLGSSEHEYSPLHTMASLLHGSSIWGSGIVGRKDFGRKEKAIRDVYQQFDTANATWIPYFQEGKPVVECADPAVRVSLYSHAGKSALLLIANFGAEAKTPVVRLNLAELGLAGQKLRLTNALTRQAIPLAEAGAAEPTLAAKSFVLAQLEVEAATPGR